MVIERLKKFYIRRPFLENRSVYGWMRYFIADGASGSHKSLVLSF